jgi:hypothetical protein
MTDETKDPEVPGRARRKAASWTLEEAWENCRGQCGADPWCQMCMREKERLHEEWLNREGRTDDKKK